MELKEAKEVIKTLAHGVDPTTGEVFPKESPYNDARVIRALFTVQNSFRSVKKPKKTFEEKQQENIANGRPRNAGFSWTDETRSEVAAQFKKGHSIGELAQTNERTKGAIMSELMKQGLIEATDR